MFVKPHLPLKTFGKMVLARRAKQKIKDFSCLDQFVAMSFAQLIASESLRDIEINLCMQNIGCHRHLCVNLYCQKRFNMDHYLYEILRVLELNILETTPISTLHCKLQHRPIAGQDLFEQILLPKLRH